MNIWYPVVTIFVGSEWISIVSCLITLITGIWYPSCTVFVFLENICYDLYILINRNNISDLHVGSWHALSVGFEILIWVYICHVCFWFFLNIIHCLSIWFNQGFFFKKCFSTFQTLKLFIEETFRCHLSCFFCALLSENCFFTMFTFVWIFACMNSLVFLQNR